MSNQNIITNVAVPNNTSTAKVTSNKKQEKEAAQENSDFGALFATLFVSNQEIQPNLAAVEMNSEGMLKFFSQGEINLQDMINLQQNGLGNKDIELLNKLLMSQDNNQFNKQNLENVDLVQLMEQVVNEESDISISDILLKLEEGKLKKGQTNDISVSKDTLIDGRKENKDLLNNAKNAENSSINITEIKDLANKNIDNKEIKDENIGLKDLIKNVKNNDSNNQNQNTLLSQGFGKTGVENLEGQANIANTQAETVSFKDIATQLINSSKASFSKEKSEIQIQLKPEHLGKINMKLVLQDGLLTAKLVVENHAVGKALEANMQQLRNSLQEQGINIEQLRVDIDQGNANQNFNQNFNQQNKNSKNDSNKFNQQILDLEQIEEELAAKNENKSIDYFA